MADDNIDFRFLGQQVRNLQTEMRDLRSTNLRLESDVVGIRADLSRLEQQVVDLAQKVDANQLVVHQQLEQLRTEITALFRSLDQKLTALDQKIESRYAALDQKIESRYAALDQKIDNHHQATQAQFKQMSDSNSTIFQVIITKLDDIETRLPPRS